jgi:ABC-type glycerol-3-phosphate transport system permease component
MVSSTIISTVATFFSVLIGLLAVFAISRYQLGRNFMALQILSFRMVPPIAVAMPFAIIGTTIGATFTPVLLTVIILNWSEGAIALALAAGHYVTIPVQIADKVASPMCRSRSPCWRRCRF